MIEFSAEVGEFIAPAFNNELYLAEIVAGILIFLGTIFTVSIIKRIIHPIDKVNKLLNQILGGISGAIQMIFFVSGFLILINVFNLPSSDDKENSFVYKDVYNAIPQTIDFIFGADSRAKTIIKDYIEKKDELEF